MLDVLGSVTVPVFLVALVGGTVGRRVGLSPATLSHAVLYLFSPCLVFIGIAEATLPLSAVAQIAAVLVAVFTVNVLVARAWSAARRHEPAAIAGAALSASVANQGNLGIPVARLAFGPEGTTIAVVVFVLGVVLWSSAGIAIASRGRHSAQAILGAPLRYPAIYAASAGLAVNVADVRLPDAVREPIVSLGSAAVPCMLLLLGLQFRPVARAALADSVAISLNRLLIGPAVAWLTAYMIGLSAPNAAGVTLGAAMPTAVTVTVLATELDARPELAVQTVVTSTLLAIPTLTVLVTLLA